MTARRARKALLTLHVSVSVGWLGAALTMLALGLFATTGPDPAARHAAFTALHAADRFVMIPVSLLALASGVAVALTSPYGLLKHYWVITKLVVTVGSMLFAALFVSQQIQAALIAPDGDLPALRARAALGSAVVLALLATATTLAVFKPWGRTPRGRRAVPAQSRP